MDSWEQALESVTVALILFEGGPQIANPRSPDSIDAADKADGLETVPGSPRVTGSPVADFGPSGESETGKWRQGASLARTLEWNSSTPSPRHDLAYDGTLRVSVVLGVFPLLLRQIPFRCGIQLAIAFTRPQPVAESHHTFNFGAARGENMQIHTVSRTFDILCSYQPGSRT